MTGEECTKIGLQNELRNWQKLREKLSERIFRLRAAVLTLQTEIDTLQQQIPKTWDNIERLHNLLGE